MIEPFETFVRKNWHLVSDCPFREWKGTLRICEKLEAAYQPGSRESFLGIGCGKTLLSTVLFPLWVWRQDPTAMILIAQHRIDYAKFITRTFAGAAERAGLCLSVQNQGFSQNEMGGRRYVTTPYQVPSIRADILVMDDAFLHVPALQIEELRFHLHCRLAPEGRSILLER